MEEAAKLDKAVAIVLQVVSDLHSNPPEISPKVLTDGTGPCVYQAFYDDDASPSPDKCKFGVGFHNTKMRINRQPSILRACALFLPHELMTIIPQWAVDEIDAFNYQPCTHIPDKSPKLTTRFASRSWKDF